MPVEKIKVLIVDDEELFLEINSRVLTKRGYEVFTANTGTDILTTVSRCRPDVIIMDHQMPGVTGTEATRILKASALYNTIPVLFFTSNSNIQALAAEAGADAYLLKSAGFEPLISLIREFTAASEQHAAS